MHLLKHLAKVNSSYQAFFYNNLHAHLDAKNEV